MLSLQLNAERTKRRLATLIRSKGPAFVEASVQKLAGDVVDRTVKAIEGGYADTPERVGTGRYRDAWILAGKAAGSRSSRAAPRAQPGDGGATYSGSGMHRTIRVFNAVEYAYQVEYGDANMSPGGHLRRAFRVVRRDALRRLRVEFKRLWGTL